MKRKGRLKRKPWPGSVRNKILIESKRICALCLYFDGDFDLKMRGQIAHIDRNPGNVEAENGAYLCKNHHDEYDIKSSQSQRLTPAELIQARLDVCSYIKSGGLPATDKNFSRPGRQRRAWGVSLAVYERRLPIYKTSIQFIRSVVRDLSPDYPEIIKFGHDTEEALFLFDERIANYLREISSQAVRLHATGKMIEAVNQGRGAPHPESLFQDNTALADWFTKQYDVIRALFAPFLRLERL